MSGYLNGYMLLFVKKKKKKVLRILCLERCYTSISTIIYTH